MKPQTRAIALLHHKHFQYLVKFIILANLTYLNQAQQIESSAIIIQRQQLNDSHHHHHHQLNLSPTKSAAKTQLELPPTGHRDSQELAAPTTLVLNPSPSPPPHTTTTITTITRQQSPPPPPQQHSATTTLPATSSHRNWIERILIHVEDINLNEQQQRQRLSDLRKDRANNEDDEDAAERFVSQAPTDSGEDLIDSATTTATTSLNVTFSWAQAQQQQQQRTAQYALAVNQLSSTTTSQALDDEQRLVDSNNVSALITAANLNNQQIDDSSRLDIVTVASKQILSCEQAYTQCALRKVCAPALKAFNDDCQELINNRTSQCSAKCLKAMIALRSSEEGDGLVNCDCQGNEYCLQSKQRSQACRPEVDQAIDPKTVVSCSTASWICMADQLCSTALDYYYRNCQSLFSQRHCSMRCNNSLAILYRQPKASKLINCHCDGSEEFPCVKYKTYTERLCLNKQTTTHAISNLQTDAADDQQHQAAAAAAATNEDDGLNLTNEPEQIPLAHLSLSPSSAVGAKYDDGDEDEYDSVSGGSGGDNAEESTAASFNGIQLVEDNWIPLMSGRYFTNLHHQQQNSQQQQKVRQQQRQQQTQRRTPQKSGKQKTKLNGSSYYHDTKRRSGRIYAFASTSSSTSLHQGDSIPIHRALLTIWLGMSILLVAVFDVYTISPQ